MDEVLSKVTVVERRSEEVGTGRRGDDEGEEERGCRQGDK